MKDSIAIDEEKPRAACLPEASRSMIQTFKFLTCATAVALLPVAMQAQDGRVWSPVNSGSTANLNTIQGGPGSTVYAAGSGTTLLQWNGSAWQEAVGWSDIVNSHARWTNANLRSLGIDQNGLVYVASPNSSSRTQIFNPSTQTWSGNITDDDNYPQPSPMGIINGVTLISAHTSGSAIIWDPANPAAASTVNLNTLLSGTFTFNPRGGASGSSSGNMWVAGDENGTGRLARGTGTSLDDWSLVVPAEDVSLNPVWRSIQAVSDSFVVFAGNGPGSGGGNGIVGFWEDSNPGEWQELGYFLNHAIQAVYADNPNSIWAAGINSSTNDNFLTYWDGSDWTEISVGGTGGLLSLTIDGEGILWASGNNGQIYMGVIPIPESGTWALIAGFLALAFVCCHRRFR